MVHHLNSSPPTNIRKVQGHQKGTETSKRDVGWLNASLKSTETRDELLLFTKYLTSTNERVCERVR